MSDGLDLDAILNFGTALLIGALVGIEREKRKADEHEPSIGGLRTFIVMALLGALGGSLAALMQAPIVLVAVVTVAGAIVLAGYVLAGKQQPGSLGLTTESAALVVCLLGAMTTLGPSRDRRARSASSRRRCSPTSSRSTVSSHRSTGTTSTRAYGS
jgi:hypothetical protein